MVEMIRFLATIDPDAVSKLSLSLVSFATGWTTQSLSFALRLRMERRRGSTDH